MVERDGEMQTGDEGGSFSLHKRRRLDLNNVNVNQMMATMECNINELPTAIDDMESKIQNMENILQVAVSKAVDMTSQKANDAREEVTKMQKIKALNIQIDEEVNSSVLTMCDMYMKITQQCMKDQMKASGLTLK